MRSAGFRKPMASKRKTKKFKTIINLGLNKWSMAKSLIVHVQAKDATLKAGIQNASEDFYAELEKKANQLIIDACERAKKNKRTTVMGKDI